MVMVVLLQGLKMARWLVDFLDIDIYDLAMVPRQLLLENESEVENILYQSRQSSKGQYQ